MIGRGKLPEAKLIYRLLKLQRHFVPEMAFKTFLVDSSSPLEGEEAKT